MMIKKQVRELWQRCFNDSEEFVDMYFRLRYKTDTNMAICSGNEVIAALQLLPYPMTFCGETVQTAYVSGACTHPDYRGRGVMRQLLSQSFARMLHNGMHLSTLIPAEPWLFDYYARMGYAPVFDYGTKELVLPDFLPFEGIEVNSVTTFRADVFGFLQRELARRPCCIQHTAEDFEVILEDLKVSNGLLLVARQKECITGIAILYKQPDHLLINELIATNKDAEYNLLHAARTHTGQERMVCLLPPQGEDIEKHQLGMARIILAKELLQLYAATHPHEEWQLELTDNQLSVNNGYYYLYNGKCMYSAQRLPGAHTQLSIGQLTARLLHPLRPYMSLMLN